MTVYSLHILPYRGAFFSHHGTPVWPWPVMGVIKCQRYVPPNISLSAKLNVASSSTATRAMTGETGAAYASTPGDDAAAAVARARTGS